MSDTARTPRLVTPPRVQNAQDLPFVWLVVSLLLFPICLAIWLALILPMFVWAGSCAVLEAVTRRAFWWGPTS